ncbi:hypothetical protein LCGC14_1387240 [marine sediment metagenome]|uniref:Uncharacterized protein n=1 Tax=marine sediment metagenome TaxID=412755 RepID=A0A0F9K108_9ZZZZ
MASIAPRWRRRSNGNMELTSADGRTKFASLTSSGSWTLGDGSFDADFKVFMGNTLNYIQADYGNAKFYVLRTGAGGDSPKGIHVDVDVLAGNGFRQGGIHISMDRALGEDVTWDGNPDCGLKIQVNNRAANASAEGATRAIDVSARNRGANISWCNGINVGARNDSGSIASQLIGMQTRLENYGTLNTEAIGLDVNLSIENDTGSPTKTGIVIRNTDQSGMTACHEAIKISHTSTNGFTNLFNFAGASGDGIASGSLKDSDAADIKSDARITVVWNGTTYYLAAYDTVQ